MWENKRDSSLLFFRHRLHTYVVVGRFPLLPLLSPILSSASSRKRRRRRFQPLIYCVRRKKSRRLFRYLKHAKKKQHTHTRRAPYFPPGQDMNTETGEGEARPSSKKKGTFIYLWNRKGINFPPPFCPFPFLSSGFRTFVLGGIFPFLSPSDKGESCQRRRREKRTENKKVFFRHKSPMSEIFFLLP